MYKTTSTTLLPVRLGQPMLNLIDTSDFMSRLSEFKLEWRFVCVSAS